MVFYVIQHKASHKFERQLPVKVYWAMLRSSVTLTLFEEGHCKLLEKHVLTHRGEVTFQDVCHREHL